MQNYGIIYQFCNFTSTLQWHPIHARF